MAAAVRGYVVRMAGDLLRGTLDPAVEAADAVEEECCGDRLGVFEGVYVEVPEEAGWPQQAVALGG